MNEKYNIAFKKFEEIVNLYFNEEKEIVISNLFNKSLFDKNEEVNEKNINENFNNFFDTINDINP